jgi:hypothetical protein
MSRWLVLVAVFAALAASTDRTPTAAACHPDRLFQKHVNLDGDRALEQVVAVDSHDCQHTSFVAYVHVHDRCHGAWQVYDLHSKGQVLEQFRIVNADGWTKRPEVFFVVRNFGMPTTGVAEVVRMDDRASGCSSAHALFKYVPRDEALRGFSIELKDAAARFRGLEVVLTKTYEADRTVTTLRYDRTRGRYVEYR